MSHCVYLGLGSNLGDRRQLLLQAIRLIGERVGRVTRQSSFLETEPWGYESPNRFLNAVIRCETAKTPREVLTLTQQIERDMGRQQKSQSSMFNAQRSMYSDRPIDIDILLYDDLQVSEPGLQIPHPLMRQRDFVMIPLREVMGQEAAEPK